MPKICWQITQGSNQAKLSKLKTQLQPELPGQQWEAQQEQIWYPRGGGAPFCYLSGHGWESWKPARIPRRKDTLQS